ncbi:MFS transporter [Micromonospora sp. SH-82]|uniref:MFS transporter n=1 Tax=Micromonospora sp. SH-82 TaxID=3132938 RepID=UPI003EBD346B
MSTYAPPAPSHVPAAAPGWRLGLLYGPAIYGVSAAAVALPVAAHDLGVRAAVAVWILAVHALGLGVGAAVAGRATDLWGPRRVLSIGIGLLATGSATCLLAATLTVVVTGRGLLAAGSGAVTATVLALGAHTPEDERPATLARIGTLMALFSATAPLAGALATTVSWRLALVLPAAAIAVIPLCWPLTRRHSRRPGRVDWAGAALLTLTALALLLATQSAVVRLPRTAVLATVATACAAGALLILHTKRHPAGFLPAVVVRDPRLYQFGLIGAGVYGGLFACVYAVPQMLTRLGHSAEMVGLLLLPAAAAGVILARLAAAASRHLPPHRVLAALAAVFSMAVALTAAVAPHPAMLVGAATLAFATFAVAQMVLTAAIAARTGQDVRGAAVGVINLIFFLGGAFGSAACAAMWDPWGLPTAFAATALLPALASISIGILPTADQPDTKG